MTNINTKKIWFFFLGFLILSSSISSCSKDDDQEPIIIQPLDDNSLPSAAILSIRVLEKNAGQLRFQMNVAVFRDSKNIEDNLKGDNFIIDTLQLYGENTLFNNDRTQLGGMGNAADYSAHMLLDQSGSISSTDPNNYRLDAAKIFCSNLGNNNNVALWSFSNWDYKEILGFTTDTAKVIAEIEKLRDREGGATPLYKSQDAAITYTKANSTKTNKAVLTFTDGEDTEYGVTADEVIAHAKQEGVHLYNIGLEDVASELLLKQAVETNGAFLYAKDARQLISIFGNLGKLLTNTATFYQTEWTVKGAASDDLFEGRGKISHDLKITLPYGGEITVPFSFEYE